jgi:hypothetical protein
MTPAARTFERLSLPELRSRIALFHWTRAIAEVHVHGTWKPTHADWAAAGAEASMRAMWRFHTQTNGWRDVGQHLTIAPDGSIWTGRDWNLAPASDTGDNGDAQRGPFMFEMVGNFDHGGDRLQGAQLYAALGIIDAVLRRFTLEATSRTVRFHRQLPGCTKTCPGSAVDYGQFLELVGAYRAGYAANVPAAA